MSNLIKRAIFGTLYVALMLGAVLCGSSLLYLLVFSFLGFSAMWEYARMVELNRTSPLRTILDGLATVYMIIIVYVWRGDYFPFLRYELLIPYFLYLIFIFVRTLYTERVLYPAELGKTLLGQFYITFPLAFASLLLPDADDLANYLLLGLVCIWANDTGAYLVGSILGKNSLFPSVSPKKSWEGFYGGVLASALSAFLISAYVSPLPLCQMQTIALGILISIFATWGDLFESMLKRNAGIKDSGNIIPGHGGILDRIDSVLFVLPMLLIVLSILEYFLPDSACAL